MIIHNGDHAEFEIQHANTPKEERPDFPFCSFDAMDWAKAFTAMHARMGADWIDRDLMLAWFASALQRGYDEGRAGLGKEVKS